MFASKFQEKDRVRFKKDGLYYYVLKKSFRATVEMWLYWIAPKYRDILFAIGSECVWEDEIEAVPDTKIPISEGLGCPSHFAFLK